MNIFSNNANFLSDCFRKGENRSRIPFVFLNWASTLLIFVLGCARSDAQALNEASFYSSVNAGSGLQSSTASGTLSDSYVVPEIASGSATASIATGLDPSLSVNASESGSLEGVTAAAQMHYQVEVVGPANIDVPVIVSANGNAPISSGFGSASIINVSGPAGSLSGDAGNSTGYASASTFAVNQDLNFLSNSPDSVSLETEITLNLQNESASVSLDPTFEIDPSFADADQYSIVYSAGAVPEPPLWMLELVGVGMFATMVKLKQNRDCRKSLSF